MRANALTGEGLRPSPPRGSTIGKMFDAWLLGKGAKVLFGGQRCLIRSVDKEGVTMVTEAGLGMQCAHMTKVELAEAQ